MPNPLLIHTIYFNKENVCCHPFFLALLNRVAQFNSSSSFFILTYCAKVGEEFPTDIILFLQSGLTKIEQGAKGRRFIYKLKGWRIIFTFYPKKELVSEHYALKNKMKF